MMRTLSILSICVLAALLQSCTTLGEDLSETFPRYHKPDSWPAELVPPIAMSTSERLGYPCGDRHCVCARDTVTRRSASTCVAKDFSDDARDY